MKAFLRDFLFRGLVSACGGPVVLAIIYGILGATGVVAHFTGQEVCLGILTIAMLAFVVAGMTAIYQVEQLPLPMKILIHGGGLYIAYILTYLINNWLQNSLIHIFVFTGIFLAGYAIIWLIVYWVEKAKTDKLNKLLKR